MQAHLDELVKKNVEWLVPSLDCPATTHYAVRIGETQFIDVVYVPSRDLHYVYLNKFYLKQNEM